MYTLDLHIRILFRIFIIDQVTIFYREEKEHFSWGLRIVMIYVYYGLIPDLRETNVAQHFFPVGAVRGVFIFFFGGGAILGLTTHIHY